MERISKPAPRTMATARSTSSSLRSMIFLPKTMRSSAPVIPIPVMERTAISRSGENSSVMAAMRKCAGMNVHYKGRRECENSKDGQHCKFGGDGAAFANPGTGGDRDGDGGSAAPVFRREQSAHAGIHQTSGGEGARRRVHLLYGERGTAHAAARAGRELPPSAGCRV